MGETLRNGNLVSNPNYQVIIHRPESQDLPEIKIFGNLPESFSFGVTANYEARLPSVFNAAEIAGAINPALGNLARGAEVFSRVSRVFQLASHQVWTGSSPISFSIPMLFDAVEDAEKDVVLPIKQLMSLTLPFRGDTGALNDVTGGKLDQYLLKPPGPVISNPDYGRVSMQIGNMNYYHSVLINDVNVTFDTRMTKNGAPISASVDVAVTTVNTPTQDDIEKFFMSTDKEGNKTKDTTYGVKYAPITDAESYAKAAFSWGNNSGSEDVVADALGDDDFSTARTADGLSPGDYFDGDL